MRAAIVLSVNTSQGFGTPVDCQAISPCSLPQMTSRQKALEPAAEGVVLCEEMWQRRPGTMDQERAQTGSSITFPAKSAPGRLARYSHHLEGVDARLRLPGRRRVRLLRVGRGTGWRRAYVAVGQQNTRCSNGGDLIESSSLDSTGSMHRPLKLYPLRPK
jgi:hypothetical protein